MKKKWPDLVRDLMEEHGVSERALCFAAGLNRSTLRRFLCGKSHLSISKLDRILELFGYELDFFKVSDPSSRLPQPVVKPTPEPKAERQPEPAPKRPLKLIRLACMEARY